MNHLIYFVKLAVGCGLCFYLFSGGKIHFSFFDYKNRSLIFQLLVLQLVMFGIGTLRWHRIAVCAYKINIPFSMATHLSWVGEFLSLFCPSSTGSDLSRIYYASKELNVSKIKLAKVTFVNRLSGFLAVVGCGTLGLFLYFQRFSLLMSIGVVLILLLISRKFLPLKKLGQVLSKRDIHFRPFSIVILSVLILMLNALSQFIIICSVTGYETINDYYLCLATQLIEALAILPANIGIGHLMFDKVLNFAEIMNGAQIYNVYFVINILFKSTGFFGWLIMRNKRRL